MLRFVYTLKHGAKEVSMEFTHDVCVLKLATGLGQVMMPTDVLVGISHKMTWQQTLHCPLPSPVYSACLNNSLLQLNTTATTPLSGRVLGGIVLDQTGRFSCLPTIAHNPAGGTGCSKHLSTVLGLSRTHVLMVSRDPFLQLRSCGNQERPTFR